MSEHRKEECKRAIRSILNTFPTEWAVEQFSEMYRDGFGERLPSKIFGYETDIDFLYSLPEIVKITNSGPGQYYLEGISDGNSNHVRKVVSRENPTKSGVCWSPSSPPKQPLWQLSNAIPHESGKESGPSQTRENSRKSNQNLHQDESPSRDSISSPIEEMLAMMNTAKNGIELWDLMYAYQRKYKKKFPFDMFSDLEKFIEFSDLDKNYRVVCKPQKSWGNNKSEEGSETQNFSNQKQHKNHDGLTDPKSNIPPADLIDHASLNVKELLSRHSGGIKLDDFLHVYSIYYREALYPKAMGFEDIEDFLMCVKERVPLRFQRVNGVKTVHFKNIGKEFLQFTNKAFKAPFIRYKEASFPPDFDFSKYHRMKLTAFNHPGEFCVQLMDGQIKDQEYQLLQQEMGKFYKERRSALYRMKESDIKPGASCATLWWYDQMWFRARILNVLPEGTVRVQHVDYGNIDIVSKSHLRYLRSDFAELPIRAISCGLAYIKPVDVKFWNPKVRALLVGRIPDTFFHGNCHCKKAKFWDPEVKPFMLDFCSGTCLHGKVQYTENGRIYLTICDRNGKNDVVSLNDKLIKKGLAEFNCYSDNDISLAQPDGKLYATVCDTNGQHSMCKYNESIQQLLGEFNYCSYDDTSLVQIPYGISPKVNAR